MRKNSNEHIIRASMEIGMSRMWEEVTGKYGRVEAGVSDLETGENILVEPYKGRERIFVGGELPESPYDEKGTRIVAIEVYL